MTEREKWFNRTHFKGDGEIFCHVQTIHPIWENFKTSLEPVLKDYPNISLSVGKDPKREKRNEQTDVWGCRWLYPGGYMGGQVVDCPIKDWNELKNYNPPDPEKHANWLKVKENIPNTKKQDKIATGFTDHGFVFLRLTYLRGFENMMIDFAEDNKNVYKLLDIVVNYWTEVVKNWVNLGVDAVNFGDDLGIQTSLPISPVAWRKFIKPAYKKVFSICRENNVEVYLHTDGYIVDIIPDLIETGVTILNPQDLVNGIDNLEKVAKNKVCLDLDIDRQKITVFGKPAEIEEHIYKCIKTLGSHKGGLSLKYAIWQETPVENIISVLSSVQKHCLIWKK